MDIGLFFMLDINVWNYSLACLSSTNLTTNGWVCWFSDFSGSNGRRESQGSLSSGASLELGTSGSGRNEVSLKGDIAT